MNTDVLLISMPFGPLFWPSIGLSLLKAGLEPLGVNTRVRYFTFDFARRIGQAFYSFVANDARLSAGEKKAIRDWVQIQAVEVQESGTTVRVLFGSDRSTVDALRAAASQP